MDVAIAAPLAPYLGIKSKLRKIFRVTAIARLIALFLAKHSSPSPTT